MRRLLIPLLPSLLFMAACSGDTAQDPITAPPVALARVVSVDLTDRIEASGQLLARNHVLVASEVSGRVTEILSDESTAVEAGTPVLAIDPERRQLELDTARARLAEAQANLRKQTREANRVRELSKRNVASKAQLEDAETGRLLARSRLDALRAQLGVADRALADARVAAPFAGLVAERFVSVGEFVQPGKNLFELVSLDPIEVEFRLSEVDSSRVQLGQVVDVRVAPYPDEVFKATVSVISPTIDPQTRTLRVKASVENPEGRLRPGLFAHADLGVSERQGVAMVPEEAILQRSDGSVVFRLVEENRVERRLVKLGAFHDGQVEIRNGLSIGDQVVTRGQSALADGAVVTVRNLDGSALRPAVAGSPETAVKAN